MWRLDNQISLPTQLRIAGTLWHLRNWARWEDRRFRWKSGRFAAFGRITRAVSEKHP
jgi:hypothetical protein